MGKEGRQIHQIMFKDKKNYGRCISWHRNKSIAIKKLNKLNKRI